MDERIELTIHSGVEVTGATRPLDEWGRWVLSCWNSMPAVPPYVSDAVLVSISNIASIARDGAEKLKDAD